MDSSIKPGPMIGEILPGFTFFGLFLFCYFRVHVFQLEWILSTGGGATIAASGLMLIISWIIGDFFDALRDSIVEEIIIYLQRKKHIKPLYWEFYFKGDKEKVEQLDEYYFSYYKLGWNFVIGISLFLFSELLLYIFAPTFIKLLPWYANVILLIVITIFLWDAVVLRKAMEELLNEERAKCSSESKS